MSKEHFVDIISNLSKYHREHEKYYAQAPLKQAITLQQISQTLKTLADRWNNSIIVTPTKGNRYVGCEDLNVTANIQHDGVLFMEGEGEPPEISRLKRDLESFASDYAETGKWLGEAMDSSWKAAQPLIQIPILADVLGERHRIIINDWQSAYLQMLAARLIRRALDLLAKISFSPNDIRADLSGQKSYPEYLYSTSEILDHAADLIAESAKLVHDNERRWRVFRRKIKQLTEKNPKGKAH